MAGDEKPKVFISYSRDDLSFADQLDAALNLTGFDCTIDRHGIRGGEDWKRRLGDLILSSDTIVFVLSPASALSEICNWEVEQATQRGKRVLAVLCKPLEGTEPPKPLQDINYIHFYNEPKSPGSGFGVGLTQLVAALNTDLDWLREHTRLLERAKEWTDSGRLETTLLFGSSISEAKMWADRRPKSAPEITPLHMEFIRASEEAEARRQDAEHQRLRAIAKAQDERAKAIAEREVSQKRELEASREVLRRTLVGLVSVSLFAVIAISVGVYAYRKRGEAEVQTAAAENNLARAAQTSSVFRATQSKNALERHDAPTAAFVALNGIPDQNSSVEFERSRPFYPEAFYALYQAWLQLRERTVLAGHTSVVRSIVNSRSGGFMLTISDDNTARLWDEKGRPLRILSGHESPLTSAAVARDGSKIILGSLDQTASVWDRSGNFKVRLTGHAGAITSVAISPDGSRALTASRDGQARLWDLEGKVVAVLSGHTDVVTNAEFSPDGARILTASSDNTAALWDLNGLLLKKLIGHSAGIVRAIHAPNGDAIVTASQDTTGRLWDRDGVHLAILTQHAGSVTSIAFSPSGKFILTGADDKKVVLWDRGGQRQKLFEGHTDSVLSVAFSPDERRIVTSAADRTARVWDSEGAELAVLSGHTGPVGAAVFADGGSSVLTASHDGTARFWDVSGKQIAKLNDGGSSVSKVRVSTVGPLWLTKQDQKVAILSNSEGKKLAELRNSSSDSDLTHIDISSNGTVLLTAYANGEILIWSQNGSVVSRIKGPWNGLATALISPDGKRVIAFAAEQGHLLDLTGTTVTTIPIQSRRLRSVQLSLDGERILVATEQGGIEVWGSDGRKLVTVRDGTERMATWFSPDGRYAVRSSASAGGDELSPAELITLESDKKSEFLRYPISSVTFSPEDNKLFVELKNGSAVMLDSSGQKLADFDRLLDGLAKAVSFSNDGSRILVISKAGQAIVLSSDGDPILSISDDGNAVQEAVFAPDGTQILTISEIGSAKLWRAYQKPQMLVDQVKAELPRCLDGSEARDLYLKAVPPEWCLAKGRVAQKETNDVAKSSAPTSTESSPDLNFAYYPPGDLANPSTGEGRRADRKVYLPNIVFPLKLGPGEHPHMTSAIWGYGGGGYDGQGEKGGSECDPRNYDPMRQRDTFCEVRGWSMPMCPAGVGKQGQSIRPPTCADNKWEVVAVTDGLITLVTSNTTVRLRADDGTEYDYLHMHPNSIGVKEGDRVQQGQVIGRVSKYMNGQRSTIYQLNFNARQPVKVGDSVKIVYVPPYSSLIAAYRRAKGLDSGIDAEGNLMVDPRHEIGAGSISRPPE
jgi:WD40 repeat protein